MPYEQNENEPVQRINPQPVDTPYQGGQPQNQYQQSGNYSGDQQYQQQGQPQKRPSNYLIWAIFCTLCCCSPLGIVSIIYAAKVDAHLAHGDYLNAKIASNNARKWALIATLLGIIVIVCYYTFMGASMNALMQDPRFNSVITGGMPY